MIVFPTRENKTVHDFQPWMTWALVWVSLIGFLWLFLPAELNFNQKSIQSEKVIREALTQQQDAGNISEAFFIRAQEDLSLIGDPNYHSNFPEVIHTLYADLRNIPEPLETWLDRDTPQQLIYVLIPHHWVLLLLAFICLPPLGFIFEHLYDRLIFAALLFLIAPAWVLMAPHVTSNFWPSPIFSWSMTSAALIAAFYVTAPRTIITLTFRTWLFHPIEARLTVPAIVFPAIYYVGLTLVNMQFSDYQHYFSAEQLATAALFGGILGLFIQLLPNRDQQFETNPKTQINQQLARAEIHFKEQQREIAVPILRNLLDQAPDLQQSRRIANLAWENHETELAERAFKTVLRKTLKLNDFLQTFQVVETMVFHHLSVPDSVLLKVAEIGVKEGEIDVVRKLIPYIQDKPNIGSKEVLHIQERLVTTIFDQKNPNHETLYELKLWFETHHSQSGALAKIEHFLSKFSPEAGLADNYAPAQQIHRHIKVCLTAINSNHLQIQTREKAKKNVPWTAVHGCFGCRSKNGPDFLGAVFIQFKRKMFSCNFTNQDILVRGTNDLLLNFPAAWDQLHQHCGTQMPFVALEDFQNTADEMDFQQAAEAFVKSQVIS